MRFGRQRHDGGDLGGDCAGGALRKPARAGKKRRQHVALEDRFGAGQRRKHCPRRDDEGDVIGNDDRRDILRDRLFPELEPVEAVGAERDEVRQLADVRERGPAQHLERQPAFPLSKIKFGSLCRARQVGDAENDLTLMDADEREHGVVRRSYKRHRAAAKRLGRFAHGNELSWSSSAARTGCASAIRRSPTRSRRPRP